MRIVRLLRRPLPAALGLLWLAGVTGAAREVIPFDDGWRFALQPSGTGFEQPAFRDDDWTPLTLPHTWNAFDGQDGGTYVRGDGWYRKRFVAPPAWTGRRIYLQFDAVNRTAEVFLNGRRVGEHVGGYGRFRFDLTDFLVPGANVLVVRANNEPRHTLPLAADFTMAGGIYRPVSLVVVDPLHVALGDYGSPGVFVDTPAISAQSATVRVRVGLENAGPTRPNAQLRVRIASPAGTLVAERAISLPPSLAERVEVSLTVPTPELWDGSGHPALYSVRAAVEAGGREIDVAEDRFGIRDLSADPARGFFLNHRRYDLHGVNYHQDRQDRGSVSTPEERARDFDLMQELGCTSIRFCHYQHADQAYTLCDERGLLAWAEFNFHFDVPDAANLEACLANASEQLRELIRQNYNRPSIFCWSLGDESTDEELGRAQKMLEALQAVARDEDRTRPTTYASHHQDEDPRNFLSDLIGFNPYYGWYYGQPADLAKRLDDFHQRHPDTPLAVSEYGAGASIFQHEQDPPFRTTSQAKGPWHPEEWQNEIHERTWPILAARPFLWANYVWVMFDFASDRRNEGDHPGRNDKGLVTYDRRTRKDAFYWYQANWTSAPMVHLTSQRDLLRVRPETPVKVYSNCEAVELFVNGVSQGRQVSGQRLFRWDRVRLQPGANRIMVEATRGDARVTDACYWQLVPGEPYWPPADP